MRHPVVGFGADMATQEALLRDFLHRHMYRHEKVNRMTEKARAVVRDLFGRYMSRPQELPAVWQPQTGDKDAETARLVTDYIAGMTDRYALAEHHRLIKQEN